MVSEACFTAMTGDRHDEQGAMDFGIIIYIRSDTVMISMNFNSYANLVIFFIISVLFCFVLNTELDMSVSCV